MERNQHKEEEIKPTQQMAIQQSKHGYVIDQEERSKFYKEIRINSFGGRFDLESSKLCLNDYDVDKEMHMKDPIDPVVVVRAPSSVSFNGALVMGSISLKAKFIIKPIAVYLEYMGPKEVQSDNTSVYFTKKKGLESRVPQIDPFILEEYVKGVTGCDNYLDVTSRYHYTESYLVHPPHTVLDSVTLNKGTYVSYQTVNVYACRFVGFSLSDGVTPAMPSNESNEFRISPNGDVTYFLLKVYRDQIVVKPYSDDLYSPVPYDQLLDYLFDKGYSRWADV